ncbi:MAG: hypothetical protein R6U36_07475 [Candidatus Fermentibacteraceae bacterium]
MKCHRIRIGPLIMAVLASACGGGEGDGPKTFDDPAGYSLEVPGGWSLSDRTAGDGLIRADITGGDGMGIQVRLLPLSPSGFDAAVSRLLREYIRDMSGHWGGGMAETERTAPDAGEKALTVRFRATRDDGSVWYLQESFVSAGDMLVVLQGGCPWERRDRARAAFDDMVDSISFP